MNRRTFLSATLGLLASAVAIPTLTKPKPKPAYTTVVYYPSVEDRKIIRTAMENYQADMKRYACQLVPNCRCTWIEVKGEWLVGGNHA